MQNTTITKTKEKKIRINQHILNYMELKILIITDDQTRRWNSQWKVSQIEILDWGILKFFLKKHTKETNREKRN